MSAIEDFAHIASRLREIEKDKEPKTPIVHDPEPPEYVEPPDDPDPWGYFGIDASLLTAPNTANE